MNDDKKSVYATTYEILKGVAKLMAPFAPFLSDEIYTNLTGEYTVHTAYYPEVDRSLINEAIENRMDLVRSIVSLGRGAREKEQIKVRQSGRSDVRLPCMPAIRPCPSRLHAPMGVPPNSKPRLDTMLRDYLGAKIGRAHV